MKDSVKVSVVVPVFKVEKYIHECIDSILNQTLDEIEVILVDDGSPDNCGIIIDNYSKLDRRVKCIHKENGGVSAARNDGIEQCTGEYIYIMDSDDYIERDALKKMYSHGRKTNADIVICDHYTHKSTGDQQENHFFSKEFYSDERDLLNSITCMILHPNYSPFPTKKNNGMGLGAPWTKMVRRAVITDNSCKFDSDVKGIFDDGLFAIEIMQNAKSVSYISDCLYHYRILSGSLIHKFNPNRNSIDRIVFKKIEELGKKYMMPPLFWEAYYARIVMYTSIELGTYIAHKMNNMNLKKRKALLKEIVNTEPYQEAFTKVKTRKVERRYRLLIGLIRAKLYSFAISLYILKN